MRDRKDNTSLAELDENEEDQYEDDSGEDWKPEKKGAKGGAKRRTTARRSTSTAKKSKKDESEDDEDEDDEEEDEDESEEEDEEESEEEGSKKKGGSSRKRPAVHVGKNQPDKDGNMELYLFKNDLTKEFRSDDKLCMWRRDGASLLQKYMVIVDQSTNDVIFKASSVYSCWEEKRKNDFFQIKVQMIGDKKDGKVKVVDIAEFERYSQEDRPKVDITPKGAEGGETYEEEDEDPDEEDEEDEE